MASLIGLKMKEQPQQALAQAKLEVPQPSATSEEFHTDRASSVDVFLSTTTSCGSKSSRDTSMKTSLSSRSSNGPTSNSEVFMISSSNKTSDEAVNDTTELSSDATLIASSKMPCVESMLTDISHNSTSLTRCSSSASDASDGTSESTWSTSSNHKPHKANDHRWEAIQSARNKHGTLGLHHFRLLKRLGCGDIGSVYLVELQGSSCYFAMKVMDKGSLASRKKLLRAQTEREILKSLDHPFLPSLYAHFDTDKFSCLVMEFCSGGDLHALRQRQPGKHFAEVAARFYAAEVLLSLEYLHMMGVIYRDLKPENVLVREDGHIMLSDFDLSLRCMVKPTLMRSSSLDMHSHNKTSVFCVEPACLEPVCMTPACVTPACIHPSSFIAKMLRSKKNLKSRNEIRSRVNPLPELVAEPTGAHSLSFVGTHEYLAPEIIKGNGHGSAVDWWTFGIFLFEFLYGRTPFKGGGDKATLFNVIGQSLMFPETPAVSFAARDLIRGLLVKDPQHRIGYTRGAAEIKQHPFFEGVNWALIRSTAPPKVPKPFEMPTNTPSPPPLARKAAEGESKSSGNYLDFDLF